jgi:hypothetical protein
LVDEVCDGVGGHRNEIWDKEFGIWLPGAFLYSWNISFQRFFAEADTAKVEITHKTARAAALEAASHGTA